MDLRCTGNLPLGRGRLQGFCAILFALWRVLNYRLRSL
jgi:hypothetical protein